MLILGLTGSIGMGKSTTAKMFVEAGIPVNDADQVVHDLYKGEAVPLVEAAFPGTTQDGAVDRTLLSAILAANPARFKELESIVHPLVRQKEQEFLDRHRAAGAKLVVLDVPLLFEMGGEDKVDKIVVVTCDPEIQKARVLERPGMSEEKYRLILSRQLADGEKRKRADFVIDTGLGLDHARRCVADIIETLMGKTI